jgi:RNA polymerase sigma factor (sigma-70 family)
VADVERKPLDSYVTPEREAAFRAAYEQHLRTVYRYLVSRSENRSDVPDLVAEVFATLWRRGETLPAEADLRAWLVTVARRVLANQRRAARRRERLFSKVAAEPEPSGRSRWIHIGLSQNVSDGRPLSAATASPPAKFGGQFGGQTTFGPRPQASQLGISSL